MDDRHNQGLQLLDRWFGSPVWEQITQDADQGCIDSHDLMIEISDQLASLTFHLQNESSDERVAYELRYFEQLCDDFNVA